VFTYQRFSLVFRRHAENFFDAANYTKISNVHKTNFYGDFIDYFQHFSAIPVKPNVFSTNDKTHFSTGFILPTGAEVHNARHINTDRFNRFERFTVFEDLIFQLYEFKATIVRVHRVPRGRYFFGDPNLMIAKSS